MQYSFIFVKLAFRSNMILKLKSPVVDSILVTQRAIFKNQKLDLYIGKMRIIYSWKTLSEYSYVFDYFKKIYLTLKNYQMLIKIVIVFYFIPQLKSPTENTNNSINSIFFLKFNLAHLCSVIHTTPVISSAISLNHNI